MNSKKVVGLAVFWSVVFCLFSVGVFAVNGDMGGGDGSEGSPWMIEDLVDFHEFAGNSSYWDDHTRLECDPNLAGIPYTTAVIAPNGSTYFTGVFDGNGHIIYNLTIDTAEAGNDYLGLFGSIEGSSAEVKNLCIENINITGGYDSNNIGGICGYNYYGKITNCYAAGSVTGGDYSDGLGGLCGGNHYGTISNCYAIVSVTGGDYSSSLGGLCGGNNSGNVSDCYSTGSVTGGYESYVLGGLCGYNWGNITNCFWDVETSGMSTSFGGMGLITEQMKDPQIYAMNGWAENSVWVIDSDQDYPRLAWQQTPGATIPAAPDISGDFAGNGTEQDPFIIYTADDLDRIATASIYFDQHYVLASDIDMSGRIYEPIGYCRGTGFSGSFDGNHHKIQNLSIAGSVYLGCFGAIESTGSVQNLGLENITITGGDFSHCLGGLCGYNYRGTITNCYATGAVTGGDNSSYLGGLCGVNYYGTIGNSYATCSVTGYAYLGGLSGYNFYGTITKCYATGPVIGGDYSHFLGGLCGYNYRGIITKCYANGPVTGNDDLGGLCGRNYDGTITNCYATGSVTGNDYLGGLCGRNYEGNISDCYFLDTAGPDNSLGEPLDDPNMRIQSSFVGWDFVGEETNGTEDQWQLCIDGYDYPRLTWQFINPADFLHPGRVDHYDLFVFTQDWLSLDSRCCDIAPVDNPDDVVNLFDYVEFSKYWLVE